MSEDRDTSVESPHAGAEGDAAEKQAREILARFPDNWSPAHREICAAVAAAIRERDAVIANLKAEAVSNHSLLNDVEAELEAARAEWKELNEHRLEAWHKYFEMKVECDELRKQVEELQAQRK